ncbi:MAG: site-specific integrase [Acidobacteria bacterium]|nr:site-specific integrase [Acidobacteriota bacterium]
MATISKRVGKKGVVRWAAKIRRRGFKDIERVFPRREEALAWADEVSVAMRNGTYREGVADPTKLPTLEEAIGRYIVEMVPKLSESNRVPTLARLKFWSAELGSVSVSKVTPGMVETAVNRLREKKLSDTSIHHYLRLLGRVFTVSARRWDMLPVDASPLRRVDVPPCEAGRTRFLTPDEIGRLLKACKESKSPFLADVVSLLLLTGARRGEICGLRWDELELDPGRERVVLSASRTKTKRARVLPLFGESLEIIRRRSAKKESPVYVFPMVKGKTKGKPVFSLKTAWAVATKRAGLTDLRIHDLRHCAASLLLQAGTDLSVIGKLLGHSTETMTSRYAHLRDDIIRTAAEKTLGAVVPFREAATK